MFNYTFSLKNIFNFCIVSLPLCFTVINNCIVYLFVSVAGRSQVAGRSSARCVRVAAMMDDRRRLITFIVQHESNNIKYVSLEGRERDSHVHVCALPN